MKELSIEEKAKAYDGLIERLKDLKFAYRFSPLSDTIEEKFPELKESENENKDEKVRKALIKLVTNHASMDLFIEYDIHLDEALSWLEKQGEQKPAEYTLKQAAGIFLDALSNTPYNNKPITDAQVITKELIKFLEDTSSYNPNAINEQKIDNEIEIPFGAKDSELQEATYYIPKGFYAEINDDKVIIKKGEKPIVWSEEDENNLYYWLDNNKSIGNDKYRWLLSLKDRVQPQPKQEWKPTKEQMDTLEYYMHALIATRHKEVLFGLYSDLREL